METLGIDAGAAAGLMEGLSNIGPHYYFSWVCVILVCALPSLTSCEWNPPRPVCDTHTYMPLVICVKTPIFTTPCLNNALAHSGASVELLTFYSGPIHPAALVGRSCRHDGDARALVPPAPHGPRAVPAAGLGLVDGGGLPAPRLLQRQDGRAGGGAVVPVHGLRQHRGGPRPPHMRRHQRLRHREVSGVGINIF